MNVLPSPSKEVIQAMHSSLGVDEQRVKEAVKMLREWLELQPHLPHVMDDRRLENIFLRSKASPEQAKSTIDMYYTMRTAVPEFYSQRDPEMQWFKTVSDAVYCTPMPRLTEENYRVIVCGILDNQVQFDVCQGLKMCCMCQEIILAQDCSAGLVFIVDAKTAAPSLVAQLTPTLFKKALFCEGFKCRIKAIHCLNVPSYAAHVVNIIKSLMKFKLVNRLLFHPPGYETLRNHFPPKALPRDMGGDAESISELWDAWKEKHHSFRDWFLKEEEYKADESRRPGKALTSEDLFGIEGTFRQLALD